MPFSTCVHSSSTARTSFAMRPSAGGQQRATGGVHLGRQASRHQRQLASAVKRRLPVGTHAPPPALASPRQHPSPLGSPTPLPPHLCHAAAPAELPLLGGLRISLVPEGGQHGRLLGGARRRTARRGPKQLHARVARRRAAVAAVSAWARRAAGVAGSSSSSSSSSAACWASPCPWACLHPALVDQPVCHIGLAAHSALHQQGAPITHGPLARAVPVRHGPCRCLRCCAALLDSAARAAPLQGEARMAGRGWAAHERRRRRRRRERQRPPSTVRPPELQHRPPRLAAPAGRPTCWPGADENWPCPRSAIAD